MLYIIYATHVYNNVIFSFVFNILCKIEYNWIVSITNEVSSIFIFDKPVYFCTRCLKIT